MNKEEALDIISDAGFGFFATVEGNKPNVRPMMPYLTEDGESFIGSFGPFQEDDPADKSQS